MFWAEIWKISEFLSENFLFLEVKFSIYLYRRVLVMRMPPCITKTCLYNFDPLKPHFYIVKLGFTGVYIIFLISAQKHRLSYSLEPPHYGGSNEYPQSMLWAEIWKISEFLSENFLFLKVKFSIYLYRRVLVMRMPPCITKTCLYNFDPLKPHFYIVKLGVYRGIHYLSYFCSKK